MPLSHSHLGYTSSPEGNLLLHGIDLTKLIRDAPIYVMNESLIRSNCQAYIQALRENYPQTSQVFYASKAMLNLSMARLMSQEGVGLDVCSQGELFIANRANFPRNKILFHGNNKNITELHEAVRNPIQVIVVDNSLEYKRITKIAQNEGVQPGIMLRVNPHIDVNTHPSLATGVRGSKFGLPIESTRTMEMIADMANNPHVKMLGLHCHIGSQITDLMPYTDAIESLINYIALLNSKGISISTINIGGGLGVDPDIPSALLIHQWVAHACQVIQKHCEKLKVTLPELMIEPGRSIVSEAGCTLYRVGSIKEMDDFTIVAVEGGMSDNIRPALFKARYPAVLANKLNQPEEPKPYKIVGSCCESGDILIQSIHLPRCEEGDILALLHTGAYSFSLANQYNKHLLPGMMFVSNEGLLEWVTKPQSLDQLCQNDYIPTHLE